MECKLDSGLRRLLLTLRFDGSAYHGWQVQPNGITVQQALQDSILAVTADRPGVTGCSRTDSGVHADMFCCMFDTGSSISCASMIKALNANLPRDIAVYGCREVPPDFHARYSAKGKQYAYSIYNSPVRNPFFEKYSWQIHRLLDIGLMNRAAAELEGKHDFSAFCAAGSSIKSDGKSTVRTVRECTVRRDGDMVVISISADGFLYNMVRIIAGTLADAGTGSRNPDSIARALKSGLREHAGITAPARGLTLKQVFYD